MKNLVLSLLLLLQGVSVPGNQSGIVEGRILGMDGKPAVGVRVSAAMAPDTGAPLTEPSMMASIVQTDAAGHFRLERIPPGRYYITAGLVDSPTFYPGVTAPTEAKVVAVTAGSVLNGIEFSMVRPAGLKFSGRVVRSNDPSPPTSAGTQVRLTGGTGPALFTNIAANGTFEFTNVRQGRYSVIVGPGVMMSPVTIVLEDKDVTGFEIAIPITKVVVGHVVVEGGGPVPRMAFSIGAPAAGLGSTIPASPRPDGTFTMSLPEGESQIALIQSSVPSGYAIKSSTYGTLDLLKVSLKLASSDTDELRVTLTSPNVARVKVIGRIVGGDRGLSGGKVTMSSVAITEILSAPIGTDGTFEIPAVFPGAYSLRATVPGAAPISIVVGGEDLKNVEIAVPAIANVSASSMDPEKVIGTLSWIITEAATGTIVDKGNGPIRLKDVAIDEVPNPSRRQTPKTIRLNSQFALSMAEFPNPSPTQITGFGMTARKTDIQSFSWEWFTVDNPTHAVKLQESGTLGIDITKVGVSWEVTRTEFQSDVSMRIIRMNVDPPGSPPFWRVQILQGSTITWPSIVNGKVVAN